MSTVQIFVIFFALVSAFVSILGIWRALKAPGVKFRPLWLLGSAFGFVGFATSLTVPADLYLQFGLQIPVLMIFHAGSGGVILKALFPIVAAIALVKFPSARSHPNE